VCNTALTQTSKKKKKRKKEKILTGRQRKKLGLLQQKTGILLAHHVCKTVEGSPKDWMDDIKRCTPDKLELKK